MVSFMIFKLLKDYFKDVIIINDESYSHNFIRIIEGNFVYFLNINQIIYITQT